MPKPIVLVVLADSLVYGQCQALLVNVDVPPVEAALALSQLPPAALISAQLHWYLP
jgi:hypothetical protein